MKPFIFGSQPGRTVIADGKEYLFFSGYAYLGMQSVPAFADLIKEGTDKYGWLFPSSRISNTRLQLFEQCEALLSSITGFEETVLFSSGFLAGRCATELWKDEVINLAPSHPAIQRNNITVNNKNEKVFAIDAVNMLTASITDFSFADKDKTQKIIIVDDSHGIGLIGKNGEGICSKLHAAKNVQYVLSYSLSKAWNINAGAVSCSKNIADALRKLPAYTAGTAPSPAMLNAFMHGQHLYKMQREKLQNNIQYFQSLIQHIPQIIYHPQLPVFILPAATDENKLREKNIIISSFAYPDPSGKKYNRIVVNALHNFADLEYLAASLNEIFR